MLRVLAIVHCPCFEGRAVVSEASVLIKDAQVNLESSATRCGVVCAPQRDCVRRLRHEGAWITPVFPTPRLSLQFMGMPCTQCEVLDVGKYSHPSYLLVVKH